MTVILTLTVAGSDSGPFNLYSNTNGYVTAFERGFWYCDGQYARLWGGTEFIGSAVTCPTIE
jgi:hypothetical protein